MIIWYNPDEQIYKCGSVDELDFELSMSQNVDSYTILMKLSDLKINIAKEILTQLNTLNDNVYLN